MGNLFTKEYIHIMPFVRKTKSNAYFKRFQTKFRRRRECKTDYYARKRMVTQDLNKYGSPKFRLVTRITNSKVICQVIFSMHKGDFRVAQSTSQELKKWGLTTGFTSYSAAYATRLFKAILDIGTTKPTTGNRVFGALKGACDGGLHVPHSVTKYPGYFREEGQKKGTYDAETHKTRIMGTHIDAYMDELRENEDDFNKQFSKWNKCLQSAKVENVEALFKKIHEGIRKDSTHTKVAHKKQPVKWMDDRRTVVKTTKGEYMVSRKFTAAERLASLQLKIKMAKEEQEA